MGSSSVSAVRFTDAEAETRVCIFRLRQGSLREQSYSNAHASACTSSVRRNKSIYECLTVSVDEERNARNNLDLIGTHESARTVNNYYRTFGKILYNKYFFVFSLQMVKFGRKKISEWKKIMEKFRFLLSRISFNGIN